MKLKSGMIRAMALSIVLSAPAAAEVAMFSQRNFQGARYSLTTDSANMNFSPRSIRVVPGEPWQICPRPFFGGDCRTISQPNAKLSLPRSFSGMVRSARPLTVPAVAPVAPPAPPPAPPAVQAPPAPKAPKAPTIVEPVKPEAAKPEPKVADPKAADPKTAEPKTPDPKTASDAPADSKIDVLKPDA